MIPKFISRNKGCRLSITEDQKFRDYLLTLPETVVVTVKRVGEKETRSLNQNSYMWAVVYKLISEHTGYDVDDVHDLMRAMFLRKHLSINTSLYQIPKSTKELTTVEMEEYLSKVREWASKEIDVYIPLPNEIET